jgi:hypothetical protein
MVGPKPKSKINAMLANWSNTPDMPNSDVLSLCHSSEKIISPEPARSPLRIQDQTTVELARRFSIRTRFTTLLA